MTVAVRSISTADAGASDFTLQEPAGVAENDILLLIAEFDPNTYIAPGYDPPSGWTLLYNHENAVDGSRAYAAWIRHGASAPDLSWNRTAGASMNHAIVATVALSGVDPALEDPWVDLTHTYLGGPKTTVDHASITTTADDSLVLFLASLPGRGYDYSGPVNANLTGLTVHFAVYETNWGNDGSIHFASGVMPTAGATGVTSFETLAANTAAQGTWHQTVGLLSSGGGGGGGTGSDSVLSYYYNN
jgi:hypothetical protein